MKLIFPGKRALCVLLGSCITLVGCDAKAMPQSENSALDAPWMDKSLTPEQRADLLLGEMNFEQKAHPDVQVRYF